MYNPTTPCERTRRMHRCNVRRDWFIDGRMQAPLPSAPASMATPSSERSRSGGVPDPGAMAGIFEGMRRRTPRKDPHPWENRRDDQDQDLEIKCRDPDCRKNVFIATLSTDERVELFCVACGTTTSPYVKDTMLMTFVYRGYDAGNVNEFEEFMGRWRGGSSDWWRGGGGGWGDGEWRVGGGWEEPGGGSAWKGGGGDEWGEGKWSVGNKRRRCD